MLQKILAVCFLLSLYVTPVSGEAAEKVQVGNQSAAELNTMIPVKMKYLLSLPENYDEKEKWPLILFLHGAGERGEDLDLVTVHGPPKLIKNGKEFPFIVVSPQCPEDQLWQPVELTALLNDIEKKYKVDKDRIYVTGLSMGGFGTWSLAAYTPYRFAALVPICGGGEKFWVKKIKHVPIWVFHGAKDTAVPLERSQTLVDVLKKEKSDVKFTVYPEAAHDSWTETYDNPEVYEWLLQQVRKPEAEVKAAEEKEKAARKAKRATAGKKK
ncbi:prolyl oligopeptidase family serine peptidase [Gimesia sp.]|uniref:carboxylesterase family protein n=1 Tax=Gimesia sp. TaxID=2024833 RepID=UPI000C43F270|nr:prolyl oligopeptidase family serine peptidase [Gimesia sp.]MAX38177.1 phospholipase [Gimesia sp.]HAH44413.1 phospholipase [Planctomycetaceae bacterium]HBL47901.1 phospholipase [Planctomycetaceae bacterium]|tara:strand:- start:15234 stop:16040 length:807 start_codon:yes stop_codon:yes gene_type:complete